MGESESFSTASALLLWVELSLLLPAPHLLAITPAVFMTSAHNEPSPDCLLTIGSPRPHILSCPPQRVLLNPLHLFPSQHLDISSNSRHSQASGFWSVAAGKTQSCKVPSSPAFLPAHPHHTLYSLGCSSPPPQANLYLQPRKTS